MNVFAALSGDFIHYYFILFKLLRKFFFFLLFIVIRVPFLSIFRASAGLLGDS